MCEFFLKVMVQLRKILVLIIGIATYVLWPLKKICVQNTRTKTTKLGVENRAQHASQRHLSVLKTDSNLAFVPRRE